MLVRISMKIIISLWKRIFVQYIVWKKGIPIRTRSGSFSLGENTSIHPRLLEFCELSKITIGMDCNIMGSLICRTGESSIEIGDRCFIGKNSVILSSSKISIGDDVLIGGDCYITDNDGHSLDSRFRRMDVLNSKLGIKDWDHVKMKEVTICDQVWIAPKSIILKGVTIGKGAVVGAASVVTHNVPDKMLVAGNPAKIIGPVPGD